MNRLLVVVEDALAPDHVDTTPYLLEMAGATATRSTTGSSS